MGLFDFLRKLFGPQQRPADPGGKSGRTPARRKARRYPRLVSLRRSSWENRHPIDAVKTKESPYLLARYCQGLRFFLDLTGDAHPEQLAALELPQFRTPAELAAWLEISPGQLGWLADRYTPGERPVSVEKAHYSYRWIAKRSGGFRLLECPKSLLKDVQYRIFDEILSRIAPHPQAHGFAVGHSIVSNAQPHVGKRVVVKLDLDNFYPRVRYSRVVAIFRSLGYCREAACWLARLTTSALPTNAPFPERDSSALDPYFSRHLPQGAPTSPALANLAAYSLDVRLGGLARSFGADYTRYADDLTFSGQQRFLRALPTFLPLVRQVIRQERFRLNRKKLKVIRDNQRQCVTGVVVNDRCNISRKDFDRLKAILTNCVRLGPAGQNRDGVENFAAHLLGRIGHVKQLNPQRGEKLLSLYRQIDWSR